MENHKLVLPGHLNHFGYLFGGYLLQWVDEYAWISASQDYPKAQFVTIGMDKVEFKKSVREGTILKFKIDCQKTGRTSVRYLVNVYRSNTLAENDMIFSTNVTFVNIDRYGNKAPLEK